MRATLVYSNYGILEEVITVRDERRSPPRGHFPETRLEDNGIWLSLAMLTLVNARSAQVR